MLSERTEEVLGKGARESADSGGGPHTLYHTMSLTTAIVLIVAPDYAIDERTLPVYRSPLIAIVLDTIDRYKRRAAHDGLAL